MDLKSSKTYQNLQTAFHGEAFASGKYNLFAAKAKEDGYQQIADIFAETSHNEMEHAEMWLRLINGGEIPDTYDNLMNAAEGEHYEWTQMYANFAQTASEEGFEEIAKSFEEVGAIEHHHNFRFDQLAKNIKDNMVFCKTEDTVWICMNCGNVLFGKCAPEICSVCGYPQGYYKENCENY